MPVVRRGICHATCSIAVAVRARKGLSNHRTVQARPSILRSTTAASTYWPAGLGHHLADFQGGIGEARRVLKDGGRAFHSTSSAGPACSIPSPAVELLLHLAVRDYPASEWTAALALPVRAAGCRTWAAAHGTSPSDGPQAHARGKKRAIRALHAAASSEDKGAPRDRTRGSLPARHLLIEDAAGWNAAGAACSSKAAGGKSRKGSTVGLRQCSHRKVGRREQETSSTPASRAPQQLLRAVREPKQTE